MTDINGTPGNDVLPHGTVGADLIRGYGGHDTLGGGDGNDTIFGDAGDDWLTGGGGNDRLDGGAGRDTAVYADNTTSLRIDLAANRVTFAGTVWKAETLVSIENAVGGSGNDVLIGTGGANVLDGGDGNDLIKGRGGDDTMSGGLGCDTLDGGSGTDTGLFDYPTVADTDRYYSGEYTSQAVHANLATGVLKLPGSGYEPGKLISIENIRTGDGDDVIVGSNAANVIWAGNGANVVDGGGGNDTIHGGSLGKLDDMGDIVTEILRGGAGNDTIYGNGNAVEAGGVYDGTMLGTDRIEGGTGNDRLVASDGATSELLGGSGADRFEFPDHVSDVGDKYQVLAGTDARILDFDRSEADKIVIDLTTPAAFDFVGESSMIRAFEYGFYKDPWSGRTTVFVGLENDWYEDSEDVPYTAGVRITLDDWSGPVLATDVMFV